MAVLRDLLDGARRGRGGAVVVRGEPGIGKSALLDETARRAAGLRVNRGWGSVAEAALPFAGLQPLLRDALDRVGELPASEAAALRDALAPAAAHGADHRLVATAVLALWTAASADRGLVLLIDDAHWLDGESARALAFAARRIGRAPVAVVFAADDTFAAPGLPVLRLARLARADAARVLREHAGDLPGDRHDHYLELADGNPLALIELPEAFEPDPPGRLKRGQAHRAYLERIRRLPDATRHALACLAAEGTGDPGTALRALRTLGLSLDELAPAEQASLVEVAPGAITFRHPLIRAAAYKDAPIGRRLAVRRVLAGVVDDAARRSWHLCAATAGPDESVAAELDRAARDAERKGDLAAASIAYERAARLTPAARQRGHRLTAAARTALACGRTERAKELAGTAAPLTDLPPDLADLAEVRAVIEAEQGSLSAAARVRVAGAAHRGSGERTAGMLLDAAYDAFSGGHRDILTDIAHRLDGLGPAGASAAAWVADALALLRGDPAPRPAGFPGLIAVGRASDAPDGVRLLAAQTALHIGADEALYGLIRPLVDRCAPTVHRPRVLRLYGKVQLSRGALPDAQATLAEALRAADEAGQHRQAAYARGTLALLAAVRGDADACERVTRDAPGDMGPILDNWRASSLALVELAGRRHARALERLDDVVTGPARHLTAAVLPDHVEAAVCLGRTSAAQESFARFTAYARHGGQPWALAVLARCRALLDPEHAHGHFAEAVRLHRAAGRPLERARTDLLYGEWLRRASKRAEARCPLRSAWEAFDRLGARLWAERAAAELRATGESLDRRDPGPDPLARLTAQEAHVVRLAATGATNRDIAAQLSLSHRTVGYHLYKAFPKLGVTSRMELQRLGLPPDRP